MSTSDIYLTPEEIAEFVRESKIAPQWTYGYEGQELSICPYVTFYIYHQPEEYMPLADKFIGIWERFQTMLDEPFAKLFKSSTQRWLKAGDKRWPTDLHAEALQHQEDFETFYLMGTDMESPDASPMWSYYASVDHVPSMDYSKLKLIFRYAWYSDGNQQAWKGFVRECVRSLQPEQCYMGYEVGNGGLSVMGAYESDVLERICADYFYGIDIDHPSRMGFHANVPHETGVMLPTDLGAGLRPPTWCFMLSPVWQRKLGKGEQQIRVELNDPRIRITSIPYATNALNPDGANGLWIELGELDLYPVEDGVPDLLVKANRLIRPIRCDELRLTTLDPWEDDPNPRFDEQSSLRWMRRFDEDSNWPSAEVRRPPKPAEEVALPRLRALPGELCPRTGWWASAAVTTGAVFVRQGEAMPGPETTPLGSVIWSFRGEANS
ncbi:MAG: DUF3396 domain-containing protein [Proteobacteria bacterium]|nr:DUF3396 domain-containing protein [Pseudomonadota bacterium]